MSRAMIRALVLSATFAAVMVQPSLALNAGSALPVPAASQQRLSTAKFGTVVPIATVGASQGLFAELEKYVDPNSKVIVIESGTFTLSELASTVAAKHLDPAIQKSGDVFQIMAPLVIWKGAELSVGKGEHLLLDGSKSALILNTGRLIVNEASIDASVASQVDSPFRPFILTVAEGSALFNDSAIRNLGFGSFAETSGLSFLGRGFSFSKPDIQVKNNTILGLVSISFIKANGSMLTDNKITDMRSSGVVVQSASDVTIANNIVTVSSGHGVRVTSRSQRVHLQHNDIVASKGHGIFVDAGSVLVAVRDNHIGESGLSGVVVKGSGCSVVSNNSVESSTFSGIRSEESFGVEISNNSVSRNNDGILLEKQAGAVSTTIHGNVFSRNSVGIRSDGHGDLRLSNNDFSMQWPRLFAGAISSETGRYLGAEEVGQNAEFIVMGEQRPLNVQLASFSAFGLAACNKSIGG